MILYDMTNFISSREKLYIYIYIPHTYIYIYSSYDETIQRKQSAQYRKRRAITVKVTLTSARCDTVSHTPMTGMIFRQVQRTVGLCFYKFRCRSDRRRRTHVTAS